MRINSPSSAVLLMIFLCGISLAGDSKTSGRPSTNLATIEDDKSASDATNALVDDYERRAQELTSQLDSHETIPNRRVLIIFALGRLRSVWAISSLIKNIEFEAPFCDLQSDSGRWSKYPSAEALVSIGTPAAQAVVVALGTETDEARIKLMLDVVFDIEGYQPGHALIEFAIKMEKKHTAKEKMLKALIAFERLQPIAPN